MSRNQTITHIRALVDKALRQGESRLPPISIMAEAVGVSKVTVWKAVKMLRAEGVLITRRGGRIEISSLVLQARLACDSQPRTKWQRVKTRLRDEIQRGMYLPGDPLPSLKQLCHSQGVSYPSIRKALRALVDEGVLSVRARRHAVAHLSLGGQGSIVLLAGADTAGKLNTFTFRTLDYYRTLESECAQNGLNLTALPVDFLVTRSLHECAAWKEAMERISRSAERVLGTMLVATGMDTGCFARFVSEFAERDGPCAVLEETGACRLPQLPARSTIRLFSIACSPRAGESVARHLCSLGHRHIAYLSPLHASHWSQARLEGLVKECRATGGQVYPCVRADLDYEQLESMANVKNAGSKDTRVDMARQNRLYQTLLTPLIEQALMIPAITAWVCASDAFALMAIDYLQQSGRQVPDTISVAGFDDSYEAFLHGLTSYNFNGPAYVRAMLRFILKPSSLPPGRYPVIIDGYVTRRPSTGNPAH